MKVYKLVGVSPGRACTPNMQKSGWTTDLALFHTFYPLFPTLTARVKYILRKKWTVSTKENVNGHGER